MQHYVLGFAFNTPMDYVVLIQKNKPAWQKGCFNGVGGKVEPGEMPSDAMAREFEEETGIGSDGQEWNHVGKMGGEGWDCQIYTRADDSLMAATTMEEETISVLPVEDVMNGKYKMISNIPFLIELCRDSKEVKKVTIEYVNS